MCSGRTPETISVVNNRAEVVRGEPNRRAGVGPPRCLGQISKQAPHDLRRHHLLPGPDPPGEQVRERFAVHLLS
jgi:hypothetical protein